MFLEAKLAPLFISLAKPRALHFYTAQLKFDTSNLDTYCHYWCHNCLTIVSQVLCYPFWQVSATTRLHK